MKQKNEPKRTFLDRLLAKILVRVMIGMSGLAIVLLFVVWFIEYRPQHIEFAYSPSPNSWDYTEYATRYDLYGHYWITRYKDHCKINCDDWVSQLDSRIKQINGNWHLKEAGGPIHTMCLRHLNVSIDANDAVQIKSYMDHDSSYPWTLICVAIHPTSNVGEVFVNMVVLKPSPAKTMMSSLYGL